MEVSHMYNEDLVTIFLGHISDILRVLGGSLVISVTAVGRMWQ
jgi:hypothetical protein